MEVIVKVDCLKQTRVKCCRCMQYHYATLNHDMLCNRCVSIILNHYPNHSSVSLILENLKQRDLKPEDNPYETK